MAALLLTVFAGAADVPSTIYRSVDPDGHVTFSDVASEPGATRLALAPGNLVGMRLPPPRATPQVGAPDTVEPDREVAIVSPAHDAAVRSNNGALTVVGRSEPALLPTEMAELLLDGTVVGRARRPTFYLANLERGTHELLLRVVDREHRRVAASRPIVFHLLRASRSNAP